ncbi:Protein tyrosine phosphatase-like protein PTPLA (contains Pro instead of catalytic Arg) [Ceraceosorus bombacis]|uniref:Very-long-chain (3R)-3-hydroxyacyl-CoA dehydratase n=1 Tax=Ceraceosorus bombacis TaxID=401625 RepID=A0A0P1BJL3_9BASI|nr:Protein tyrosine phosphatase-like protein PTPLA (contains Pro instead of catalytic Arg) [Ceraceosorus bombacis]
MADKKSNAVVKPTSEKSGPVSKSKSKARRPAGLPSVALRGYLILYNLLSFFLWALVLSVTIKHLAVGPQTRTLPTRLAEQALARFRPLRGFVHPTLPLWLPEKLKELWDRSTLLHSFLGGLLAFTQSLALLEILHAALGLVKSPVVTTTIQVFSRLLLVWGVAERFPGAAANPWFASMVLAWSITECVRYPFYANALMSGGGPEEGSGLLWARYTFFYILYPLGAASEAQLLLATLPKKWFWQSTAGWDVRAYVYLGLWTLWWPGLYIMYTHMIKQRRRAIGKGFWGDKQTKAIAEAKKVKSK